MSQFKPILNWIDQQQSAMVDLAVQWANINSHTLNVDGVKAMGEELNRAFSPLSDDIQWVDFSPAEKVNAKGEIELITVAPALCVVKRPQASKQILFVCHMDTVYPADSDFQVCQKLNEETIGGPGITDAKGGIVVMLKALEALEQSPHAQEFGWKVILNTDEEIGSTASGEFLKKEAKNYDLGLVFEPSLDDGCLVGARKGSGNFTLVCHGKSAHAGRDHDKGINAIDALAQCITQLSQLSNQRRGLTVNFGKVHGGTANNVVADLAIGSFNVRCLNSEDQFFAEEQIKGIVNDVVQKHKVKLDIHGEFSAPPKPLNDDILKMLKNLKNAAQDLGFELDWCDSGGVCDGNRLVAAGLPTVDTLGVQGGKIHSSEEYLYVPSLKERTKLTTLFLLRWMTGEYS